MKNKTNLLMTCITLLILSIAISGCTDSKQDTSTADAKTELKNILSKKGTLEYKISYTMNREGLEDSTMTQYLKGENMRVDATINDMESRAYMKESEMYSCSKTPEGWMCFGFETTEDVKDYIQTDYLTENHEAYSVKRMEKRTIAGVSAQCYKTESIQDNSYFEYCYSSDNIPLYMKTVSSEPGTTSTEMTATSYSTSVSNSDFELPAEPMDMSNIMEGMTSEDPCGLCDMIPEESRQACLEDCKTQ